jgi:hypothetical protein
MLKRITAVAFVVLSSSMWMGVANAALIDVRFGTPTIGGYSGAAVIGTAGDTWNLITANGLSDELVDSTNVGTGVTLNLTSLGVGNLAGNEGPFDDTPYENLFNGITAANTATVGAPTAITVVLNNLAPGTYDLYVLSAPNHPVEASRALTVSANGTTPVTIGPNAGATTLLEGINWRHLQPVVGVNGILTISGTLGGGDEGNLNGFQLVPVPEPSGLALISIAALGSVAKLRRRRS